MIPEDIKSLFINNGWEQDEYGFFSKMKKIKTGLIINNVQQEQEVYYTIEFNTITNEDTNEIEFYGYRLNANMMHIDEYFQTEEELYNKIKNYI